MAGEPKWRKSYHCVLYFYSESRECTYTFRTFFLNKLIFSRESTFWLKAGRSLIYGNVRVYGNNYVRLNGSK